MTSYNSLVKSKILVVGGGGREHALVWRLRRDNPDAELFAAPGNPGIAELATCVPINATDIDGLMAFARQNEIDWTLVGSRGAARRRHRGCVPRGEAADLRPDGAPARCSRRRRRSRKQLMIDAGVPTARAITVETVEDADRAIDALGAPVVVKASGLAAGKGVIVCQTSHEAKMAATIDARRQRVRRGRCYGAHRRIHGGRRALRLRAHRRHEHGRAARRAGSQATARRRSRPEHRRHGRVLPRVHRRANAAADRRCPRHRRGTDTRRYARARNAVHRSALRRPDADDRRSEGRRVQLPLWRSGDAGGAARALRLGDRSRR